jgi:hypothetical protein
MIFSKEIIMDNIILEHNEKKTNSNTSNKYALK